MAERPVRSEVKRMALSPFIQLGLPLTARERPRVCSTRPVVSSMAISLVPPWSQRVAAMRSPEWDQRGSDQTVSGELLVRGLRGAAPFGVRGERRAVLLG